MVEEHSKYFLSLYYASDKKRFAVPAISALIRHDRSRRALLAVSMKKNFLFPGS